MCLPVRREWKHDGSYSTANNDDWGLHVPSRSEGMETLLNF